MNGQAGLNLVAARMRGEDPLGSGEIGQDATNVLSAAYMAHLRNELVAERRAAAQVKRGARGSQEIAELIINDNGAVLEQDDLTYLAGVIAKNLPQALADEEKQRGGPLDRATRIATAKAVHEQAVPRLLCGRENFR